MTIFKATLTNVGLAVLQGNFEFNHKQIIERIQERDRTYLLLYQGQLDLSNECLSTQRQLSTLVVPAVIAIRRELELPIDEAVYKRLMDQLLLKQQANTEEFIRQVRGLLEEMATKIEPRQDGSEETQKTREAIPSQ